MQQEAGKVVGASAVPPAGNAPEPHKQANDSAGRRHHLTSEQGRALVTLAAYPGGCTEGVLRSHGFTVGLIAALIRGGLIRAEAEFKLRDGRIKGVVRLVITASGQDALPAGISL